MSNLEEKIIKNCSSTLAGLKTATLFNMKIENLDIFKEELKYVNSELNTKDIYADILRYDSKCSIIYVYRKSELLSKLKKQKSQEILKVSGYPRESENYIKHLKRRLSLDSCPHEIGLFLGFPEEDVKAYIINNGCNFKYCGFWKVYYNIESAIKTFEQFKICSRIYHKALKQGIGLENLAVAV